MTTEQFEQIVATIDKGLSSHTEKRVIGESSTVTIGLMVLLITFIIGSFIYIGDVKKEITIEMEKRFVQAQDVAGMRVQIEGMVQTQNDMKTDIREIKNALEGGKIKVR